MRGELKRRKAFTLIELIISIAIIGLLMALIIPGIDRNLSRNSVANDAELFKSKLEEVRLMAGSTQQIDETGNNPGSSTADDVKYYAIILHRLNPSQDQYFSVVRISSPFTGSGAGVCSFGGKNGILTQAENEEGPCFVQRVLLSEGVKISIKTQTGQAGPDVFLIGYKAPTQQFTAFMRPNPGGAWAEVEPVFSDPVFELTYQDKKAIVNIDDFTGRVTVQYEDK